MPHIALAQIFSRTAYRAGYFLTMTQGFSPRPKLSFAPELPAGVVALNEPMDMYFAYEPQDVISRLNASLPEGFAVSRAYTVADDAPSLGKNCTHAEYLLRITSSPHRGLSDLAAKFFGDAIVLSEHVTDWLRFILTDPAQHPIGGLVKSLVRDGVIAGWHEVNIVRIAVGRYEEGGVTLHA